MYYKAIVMEINNIYATVMKNDGLIAFIKYRQGLSIGDNILFIDSDIYRKEKKYAIAPFINVKFSSLVACAAIILLIFTAFLFEINNLLFTDVYAIVSIGTNSEIEIDLDKNKKIVNVKSVDKKSLKSIKKLKGMSIEECSLLIMQILKESSLFKNEYNLHISLGFINDEDENDMEYKYYIENLLKNNLKNIYDTDYNDDLKNNSEVIEKNKINDNEKRNNILNNDNNNNINDSDNKNMNENNSSKPANTHNNAIKDDDSLTDKNDEDNIDENDDDSNAENEYDNEEDNIDENDDNSNTENEYDNEEENDENDNEDNKDKIEKNENDTLDNEDEEEDSEDDSIDEDKEDELDNDLEDDSEERKEL